jgi:cell division protein FtsB
MRIANVMSADLVQRPAANPNGLLSAVDAPQSLQANMTTETKPETTPAPDAAALAAKDSQIATFKAEAEKQVAELSKLTDTHKAALAEKDGLIATLTADKAKAEAAVAELSKERDELKAKVEDLAAYDARQLGVAPVKVAHAQLARKSASYKTPEEMLTAYEAMPEGSEKRAFRKLNREALFAAFSVRK